MKNLKLSSLIITFGCFTLAGMAQDKHQEKGQQHQEKVIQPVGSDKTIQFDIRFIVATNENLPSSVEAGDFREDLYHRLNELKITVPPLKEREQITKTLKEVKGNKSRAARLLHITRKTLYDKMRKYGLG